MARESGSSSSSLSLRRLAGVGAFLGAAAVLAGCPIYDDDDNYYATPSPGGACNSSYDCPNGYTCSGGYCSSSASGCTSPSQCPSGSTCGTDGRCHAGTCSTFGCPSGFTCALSGGAVKCIPVSGPTDGGADAKLPPAECTSDTTCVAKTGAGSKCLNGTCVVPADQCSDATQCPGTSQCVDGVCTPSCDATHPCPTGYACDAAKGVCTGNPSPCTSSTQCSGSNVCIGGRCVAECSATNACGAGLVCVGGGCVPNQKPNFVCQQEGVQDKCAKGSICLHHSCYIACTSPDAGPDAAADAGSGTCAAADKFNVCKAVTTSSGSYSVCGSTSNLGTECDPTQNKACSAGKVCIDGFCR